MKFQNKNNECIQAQQQLQQWYATELGQSTYQQVDTALQQILPKIFGYQGIQVGSLGEVPSLIDKAEMYRKITLDSSVLSPGVDICCDMMHLPIASDSVNLVILPHTLDFCSEPHQVLRETNRVLCEDGQILIIGFNPISLFGVRKFFDKLRSKVPWNGGFYRRQRVIDWLSLLNYRVKYEEAVFSGMPINNAHLLKISNYFERLPKLFRVFGSVYIIHVRKQSIPMNLIRPKWDQAITNVVSKGLAQGASARTKAKSKRSKRL